MARISLFMTMVLATIVMYVGALVLNEIFFPSSEFSRGINWVYLPAGIRLLSVLLFWNAGTVGLLLVSWLVGFVYYFPENFERAFMGGILSAAAPYLVCRLAALSFGLTASLSNLTPRRLFVCIVACSLLSPLLHHMWLFLSERENEGAPGLIVMVVGDFGGTLLVVYFFKFILAAFSRRGQKNR